VAPAPLQMVHLFIYHFSFSHADADGQSCVRNLKLIEIHFVIPPV
jgi:hypothetical protein